MTDVQAQIRIECERLLKDITPGEWTIGSERDIADNCVNSNRAMDQDGDWQDGESSVAFTCYDSPNYAADMRFIAAAPRLIRELLALLPIHGDERGRTAEEENLGANGQHEVTPTSATRADQPADSDARRENVVTRGGSVRGFGG